MPSSVSQSVLTAAHDLENWIIERRRHLHQHPELSFREAETAAFVEAELRALGCDRIRTRLNGNYGLCAELPGKDPGRIVALRADMDALPIQEEWPTDFESKNRGIGHMCGHDAHTAMLLGAAKLLKEREADLPYTVRLFFQGAEEKTPGGANDFIAEGLLEDVSAIYGLHVDPRHDTGTLHLIEGAALAGVNEFELTVHGRGGHAAFPHTTIDPVPAACQIVMGLQTIVSRATDPFDQAVVSVTQLAGGEANNVIPETVRVGGTVRSFRTDMADYFADRIRRVAEGIAAAHGCTAELDMKAGYPPLLNDPGALETMRRTAGGIFGEGVTPGEPIMASEDFSFYTHKAPGAFAFLGTSAPEDSERYMLHHPKFHIDESALHRGTALLAALALGT